MTSLQSTAPRHRHPVPPLRIAMLGTTGLPAGTDALPTAVEEIGSRLVRHGHAVTVYGATGGADEHLGMRCVTPRALPPFPVASRTVLATAHLLTRRRTDVAFVFRGADTGFLPLIRARGTAVAVHVDPTMWQGRRGRAAEDFAALEADALVADAPTVQARLLDGLGVPAELIGYGARIVRHAPTDLLEALGIVPGGFHLLLVGTEAEAHVDEIVEGFHRSDAHLRLVVAAASPAALLAVDRIRGLTARDPRILVLTGATDARLLDQLAAHAASAVHGAAIGATAPALLRVMGAGTAVLAWDAALNREVVGTAGSYFSSPAQIARQVEEVERYPFRFRDIGELMQERARTRFDWDVVAEQYQALAAKLSRGFSTRGMAVRRRPDATWPDLTTELEAQHG